MAQQTGRITIDLGGGNVLTSKEGASLQIGGIQRDDALTDNGDHYWKEKAIAAEVDATMIHTTDSDLVAMQHMTGRQVTFETDTGQTFLMADAVFKSAGTLKNGEVDVKFGGRPAEKV